jgi:glycerol-1-phosphate dehydrogenase [NAD(P)+]
MNMTSARPEIHIGPDSVAAFSGFRKARGLSRFLLVADRNTYACLGAAVERELRGGAAEVIPVIFDDYELLVDARSILKVLLSYAPAQCTFVAVGSGTVTDITRFVSHRTGNAFVSLPTAPSVDGYSTTNVPMMVDGIKQSFTAHAPVAIFADTGILAAAPRAMIAAGFGDMLGKYTSIADWRLGHLLWSTPYDQAIARRAAAAVDSCAACAGDIGAAAPGAVATLMEALLESGFCMTDFGGSLPASGTEHHYSHFWEMKLLREGRPSILHGKKVGVATVLVSRLYQQVRRLSAQDARELLLNARRPARGELEARIEKAFGPMAGEILHVQSAFLDLDEDGHRRLCAKVVDCWPQIQSIAAEVPPPDRLTELLASAGGPASPQAAGLGREDVDLAAGNALYLRKHFTVARLIDLLYPSTGAKPFLRS